MEGKNVMPMSVRKAVVDVIVDQRPLRLGHRPLHRVELGGDVEAGLALLDHRDDTAQMPFGTFQPRGDGRVACMAVRFCHIANLTPRGG